MNMRFPQTDENDKFISDDGKEITVVSRGTYASVISYDPLDGPWNRMGDPKKLATLELVKCIDKLNELDEKYAWQKYHRYRHIKDISAEEYDNSMSWAQESTQKKLVEFIDEHIQRMDGK